MDRLTHEHDTWTSIGLEALEILCRLHVQMIEKDAGLVKVPRQGMPKGGRALRAPICDRRNINHSRPLRC